MISVKKILLAGVSLLLPSGPAGAQALHGLPEMDRRATRIRHLHLPLFLPALSDRRGLVEAGWGPAAADRGQRRAVAAGGEEPPRGADLREGLQDGLFHREGFL